MGSDIRSPLLASTLLDDDILFGSPVKTFGNEINHGKRTQRAPVFDLEDVVKDDVETQKGEKELPYSLRNEICFFFKRGIPLGLSSLLQWGIPSMYFTLVFLQLLNSQLL